MSFVRLCIIAFLCTSSIANTIATAQPIPIKNRNGVYEFYGNPLVASGRGAEPRIALFIDERENILQCFKHTRAAKVAPLYKELASKTYSK